MRLQALMALCRRKAKSASNYGRVFLKYAGILSPFSEIVSAP